MAYLYSYVKGLIQVVADALGDHPSRIALGDPTGAPLSYPTDQQAGPRTWDPGRMWASGTSPPDMIFKEMAQVMDTTWTPWANINTMPTNVDPVIVDSVGVSAVAKDEVLDILYVFWSPPFTAGTYCPHATLGMAPSTQGYPTLAAAQVGIRFYAAATGVLVPINSQSVFVSATGRV